jgi:hypothetical protein
MSESDTEREQEEAAGAEAAQIGGTVSDQPAPDGEEQLDEAQRPLVEAGQGEAEGFEQTELELVDNASHGDQHAARRAIEDRPDASDDARAAAPGEADHERSSERPAAD